MPLPDSPNGYIDFAAVTKQQKKKIDRFLFKKANERTDCDVMPSNDMRRLLEKESFHNCGQSFMRMHDMQCGKTYDGHVCLLHIVSIVDEWDLPFIAELPNIHKLDEETYAQYVTKNVQDPHIPFGTVVFRGYPLGKDIEDFTKKHIDLIHTVYPKGGMTRKRTGKCGFFQMHWTRQGSQNNRSMGQVSDGSRHGYYDAAECDESLATHLSPTINAMAALTRTVQASSGQVAIGTIEAAYRQPDSDGLRDVNITSRDICPYNITTGPRFYPEQGWSESFSNGYHRDGDALNKEQTKRVKEYIHTSNSPRLKKHFQMKEERFKDIKDSNRISLPTTCAWKQRCRPEDYGYIHSQHFVVAEAGMSFNLSSTVYDNLRSYLDKPSQNIILGATFFGSLIGHLTSMSMYEVEGEQGVTTIMPGDAALEAWGSSGGYAYLNIRTRAARRARIIHTINRIHVNTGQFPRRLTQVSLDEYLIMGGQNGRIPQGWRPNVQNELDEMIAGRGAAGRGRGGRGRGRGGRGRGG